MDTDRILFILFATLLFGSLSVYLPFSRAALKNGGRIVTAQLGIPDVFFLLSFGGGLAFLMFPPSEAAETDLHRTATSGIIFQILMLFIIFGFWLIRRISLSQLLGLFRVNFFKAALMGLGLLFAAYPIIVAATLPFHQPDTEKQLAVELLQKAVSQNDYYALTLFAISSCILAPLMEEILFRGYFYAVLKKFLGIPFAMLLSAGIFAAIHIHAPIIPALFVLAICLTLAYEYSGSIVVPITMHMLFNVGTVLTIFMNGNS